jgi:hypothetical protein
MGQRPNTWRPKLSTRLWFTVFLLADTDEVKFREGSGESVRASAEFRSVCVFFGNPASGLSAKSGGRFSFGPV